MINTGRVGGENGEKITAQESVEIITQICRGAIKWQVDADWNYLVPVEIPNIDLKLYNPMNYYSEEEYNERTRILKQERKAWLTQYQELQPDIISSLNLQ